MATLSRRTTHNCRNISQSSTYRIPLSLILSSNSSSRVSQVTCRAQLAQAEAWRRRLSPKGIGTSTMRLYPMWQTLSSMSSASGATVMCVSSIRCTTRRPRSTSPAGPCATRTTTMWTSWRRVAWACWSARSTAPCPTVPRSICVRPFATRRVANRRARRVPTKVAAAGDWRLSPVAGTVATRSPTSGGTRAMPSSFRPRACTIICVPIPRTRVSPSALSVVFRWDRVRQQRALRERVAPPRSQSLPDWSSKWRWVEKPKKVVGIILRSLQTLQAAAESHGKGAKTQHCQQSTGTFRFGDISV